AKGGGLAKRQADNLAAGTCAHDADGVGRDGARAKALPQTELDQDPAGVGRELQAGAGLLEPLRLFQHDNAKTLGRERQRSRQSPDPGACDEDSARGRHLSDQATLWKCGTTLSDIVVTWSGDGGGRKQTHAAI